MATTAVTTTTERPSQVKVRLKANDESLQLPEEVGAILISTDVRRYQLSTLVNKLLDASRPIPLEFLINGQFLRTTIDEYLTQNGISAETTLNIEYVRALIPPLPVASYPHDDWVSSVGILSHQEQPRILSGSFDGNLRIWDTSSNIIATGAGPTGPVFDADFVSASKIASAGFDRTIRIWDFKDCHGPEGTATLNCSLELYGHTSAIDAIAVHKPSSRILSASWDHTIGVWSTSKSSLPPAPENLLPNSNKRRKISKQTDHVSQRGALALLSGHTARVAGVCFDDKDSTVAYSAAWDHAVKTWDLTTSTCVDTRTTSQALYCVEHLPSLTLLAVGTSARHITLVDPRASATTISALTLKGHTNAISAIVKDPNTTYQIISSSHDGTCRIWDLRSSRSDMDGKSTDAVYVIERDSAKGQPAHPAGDGIKVFDVAWDKEIGIASAGEDMKLQINRSS